MSTKFTHNGVEITLNDNGKFSAMTSAGRIQAASLDAIKKRLDKKDEFVPFRAFRIGGWGPTELIELTVVGVKKSRTRYGGDEWLTDKGGAYPSLHVDTPENRAAALAYLELRKQHAEVRRQHEKEEEAASEAIVSVKPSDKAKA